MTPRERINREMMTIIQSVKDNVTTDLLQAQRQGKIQIDEKQLAQVSSLVNQLIDATYYRSNKAFMRAVDAALESGGVPGPEKKA